MSLSYKSFVEVLPCQGINYFSVIYGKNTFTRVISFCMYFCRGPELKYLQNWTLGHIIPIDVSVY